MQRLTIAGPGSSEIIIKKSRFITSLARVTTNDEAEAFVAQVRAANKKANHNVWAARIAWPVAVERASDDGEPSGTAGAPTLRGLTSHDLSNVVAVTTRYFGGIKLGASGLIRAYTSGVTEAIRKVGLVELQQQDELLVTCDYSSYQPLLNKLREQNVTPDDSDFTSAVTLHLFLTAEQLAPVKALATELTSGQATFAQGGSRTAEVPVPVN